MPRFSESFIQQVAQAIDIVDLVGQYVSLTRRGREFVGVCPFHDDHKPSMYVSPAKQIFKCFSCGAGGGVYQFITLYEKVSFPEAVRMLAERAHIPLPRQADPNPAPEGLSKPELAEVTAMAAEFYQRALRTRPGAEALAYARDRGLTEESIERFGLGYAPPGWDALIKAARKRGLSERQLVSAGLAVQRENKPGCYDRLRNRLVFPIEDATGRVIAFGGRALSPEERAKYLNTAESILFDKSRNLYGLSWGREGIASGGRAVVVEGYLDVLMPLQAGVEGVVATLGTSLTEHHVRLLARYAREAVLVFDADTAGAAATERAMELFLAQRLNVRVATIPSGKDPCDYVLAEGPEAFGSLLDAAPDALAYAWGQRQKQWQEAGGNLADRGAAVEDFLRLVVTSTGFDAIDEVRRGQLAQHIGHLLNVPAADLQQQMRRLARRMRRRGREGGGDATEAPRHRRDPATVQAEKELLEVLLNRPELFDEVAERLDWHDIRDETYRRLAERVWLLGGDGTLSLDQLLAEEAVSDLGGLMTDLAAAGEHRGNFEETARGAVAHLLYCKEMRRLRSPDEGAYDDDALRQVARRLKAADLRRRPKIV